MSEPQVWELRAEVDRLEARLREQASSFCKAHDEVTKGYFAVRQKLDLSARYVDEQGGPKMERTLWTARRRIVQPTVTISIN